jgi:hypothetical protein
MSGRIKYDKRTTHRAAELLDSGASIHEVRDTLRAELGVYPSVGWVHNLRAGRRASGPPPAVAAVADAVADAPTSRAALPPSSDEDIIHHLRVEVSEYAHLAREARAHGDAARAKTYTTALTTAVAQLRQLTKGDDEDPDDAPGVAGATVRAAAASARQRIMTALARVQDERAAWPACPHCGQPMRSEG